MDETEDLGAFRAELHAWLEENCPPSMRDGRNDEASICWGGKKWQFTSQDQQTWLERCVMKGYTVPTWPVEFGGAGFNR
ncbi:acyl-CoA dehydrogenase, partial [Cribrihabitans sp. XS_ASV171]